jgi:7,8-didemethyl-8-hydroxy-5-deazariboflavin synthase CofG subunit
MNLQAPPNLSPDALAELVGAGINDWGGISPLTMDYVNPEAPWPHVDRLRALCQAQGYELVARLPIYPEYIDERFVDAAMMTTIERFADTVARPIPGVAA